MRPKKNNLDYYRHDNNMRNDKKIKAIRGKFGNLEGYAIYNMLLEAISEEDLLQVKWDDISIDIIAGDFGITSEFLRQIVEYSLQLKLFLLQNGYLKCAALEKRHEDVFQKRGRNLDKLRVSATETNISSTETRVSATESTHSIEENSIEKNRISNIIEFFNSVCSTSYRSSSINTQKHLKARFREGYTNEDIKLVIGFKNSKWSKDKKMSAYLRPETLFGTKFESYLQEAKRETTQKPKTDLTQLYT